MGHVHDVCPMGVPMRCLYGRVPLSFSLLRGAAAFFLGLIVATASPLVAANRESRISVSVDEQKATITAADLTPGTDALVYGYGASVAGYDRVFKEWHAIVSDDDHDGIIKYTLDQQLPWRSIWVVVDLRNAKFGVGSPAGYHVAVTTYPRTFTKRASGLLDQVTSMAPWIHGVYVHPGGGAWLLSAYDGQAGDADSKRDGFTSIALPSFKPLSEAAERPKEFVPGGVLIIVDPLHMRLDSALLDGSILNSRGAQ